jgi:hypothetical protein
VLGLVTFMLRAPSIWKTVADCNAAIFRERAIWRSHEKNTLSARAYEPLRRCYQLLLQRGEGGEMV